MRELARRLRKIEAATSHIASRTSVEAMTDAEREAALAEFIVIRERIGREAAEDAEWAGLTPQQALERFEAFRRSTEGILITPAPGGEHEHVAL